MKHTQPKTFSGKLIVLVLALLLALFGGGAGLTALFNTSHTPNTLPASGEVSVTLLNVGQANAVVIRTSDNKTVLIDAGNDSGSDSEKVTGYSSDVNTALNAMGVSQIDLFVITHWHDDHMGDASAVIKGHQINQALISDHYNTSKSCLETLDLLENYGVPSETPQPGAQYTVGDCRFTLCGPTEDYGNDLNNTSLVLRMDHGDNSFLFTGDIEEKAETAMLAAGEPLDTDVLLAAHHGSDTSNRSDFLSAVSPDSILISVGKNNKYKHPGKATLERFAAITPKVYRTDLVGPITVTSDGHELTITP